MNLLRAPISRLRSSPHASAAAVLDASAAAVLDATSVRSRRFLHTF